MSRKDPYSRVGRLGLSLGLLLTSLVTLGWRLAAAASSLKWTNEGIYLSGLEGSGEGMRVKCSAHCQETKKWEPEKTEALNPS